MNGINTLLLHMLNHGMLTTAQVVQRYAGTITSAQVTAALAAYVLVHG
jgi:hypothetical protein